MGGPTIRPKKIEEEPKLNCTDLSKLMGVDEQLLKRFLQAYNVNRDISVSDFKKLMVDSGLSYADSRWYRTRGMDARAIMKFFQSDKKKQDPVKEAELSSKLEGAMLMAIAAKQAGMSDSEIFKLVGKKALTEGRVNYFDGVTTSTVEISLAGHMGVAYLGLERLDEKAPNCNVPELMDDYISGLMRLMQGAKTANEAAEKLRYSEQLEALTTALSCSSSMIMEGLKYQPGALNTMAKEIEGRFQTLPTQLIAIAEGVDPRFAKKVKKSMDDEKELEALRRFFGANFLLRNYYRYGGDAASANASWDLALYSYVAAMAANYAGTSRKARAFADGMYRMQDFLGDQLGYLQ
ncbi:hypothetical protein KJ780_04230, partial [Candidatus Micrarchaeota archaeon]|nr:hypothetical protein [Candidatus Micrarchaeota archaeon]